MKKEELVKLILKNPRYKLLPDPKYNKNDLMKFKKEHLEEFRFHLDNAEGNGLFDSLKNLAARGNNFIHNVYRANNCNGKARPLELGEYHYGCHNYTGPGTRIDLYPNYPPYNNIDNCSRTHDLDYSDIRKKLESGKITQEEAARLVHQADSDAVACYNKYPNEDGYRQAMLGISGKFLTEKLASKLRGKDSVIYS